MASSSATLPGSFKSLADNPLDFFKKNAFVDALKPVPKEYSASDKATFKSGVALVKLVQAPVKTTSEVKFQANLHFVPKENAKSEKEAIQAYVLGYKNNTGTDPASYVDIPKTNPPVVFLFTVGLNGCSVVVTPSPDGKSYRIFHDRRQDSAVLYNDVKLCVNYDDYRMGGRHEYSHYGNAITLLVFKDGAWKMFLQRQLPEADPSAKTPKYELYADEKTTSPSPAALEKEFINRRTIIQNRIKNNAKLLKVDDKVIAAAKDGAVTGVKYDESAIAGWAALRLASKAKIDAADVPAKDNDTYVRFEEDLGDSKDIDVTWICLQIKKQGH